MGLYCIFKRVVYNKREVIKVKYKAAIFDMDGTILNTIDDLTGALNYALEKAGHDHHYTSDDVKNFFGSGVQVAITRSLCKEAGSSFEELVKVGTKDEVLPASVTASEVNRIQKIFRAYYVDHCRIQTRPYDGILPMLKKLRQNGVKLAVVSNKQNDAVKELVADLFDGYFDFYLGEQAGIRRKPAPDMTNECLRVLNTSREEAVYIGDSEIDVQTAENSGLDEIAVSWGFRSVDFLHQHGAKQIVNDADELYQAIVG